MKGNIFISKTYHISSTIWLVNDWMVKKLQLLTTWKAEWKQQSASPFSMSCRRMRLSFNCRWKPKKSYDWRYVSSDTFAYRLNGRSVLTRTVWTATEYSITTATWNSITNATKLSILCWTRTKPILWKIQKSAKTGCTSFERGRTLVRFRTIFL